MLARFNHFVLATVAAICISIVSPKEMSAKPVSLLKPLLSTADAIVIAESLSFHWEEQHVDQSLRIIRVLKGNLAPGDKVQVSMQVRTSIAKPLSAGAFGYYGIYFLTASQNNTRQLLKIPDSAPTYPYSYRVIQSDLPTQFSYSDSDSLGNRLAWELAAAVYEADGRGILCFEYRLPCGNWRRAHSRANLCTVCSQPVASSSVDRTGGTDHEWEL